MKRKKRIMPILIKLAAAVFSIYIVMMLIHIQISANEGKQPLLELEKKVAEQELINAGIRQRIESEMSDQYIIDTARNKLGLVMPNERIFVDVSH